MNRPRIAVVTPGSFAVPSTRSSSVERVVYEVTRLLQEQADCHVYGIRAPGYAASEVNEGVTYLRVTGRRRKGYIQAVNNRIRKQRYDLIQVDNRPRHARFLKRRHPRTPVWLFLHSLNFVNKPHIGQRELASCFRHTDRILVNSHFLLERMAQRFPAIRSKLRVNYLGVNREQFVSRWSEEGKLFREDMLAKHGLQNRKIILYVGRLIKTKGIHHLLQAMPDIVKQEPDAMLLIVGGAFYGSRRTTNYVRQLHRMGSKMPQHVRFVPYVPYNQISDWFRIADVAVVPSSQREAFGLVNVEAMASGVPVIATRAGGMIEIIEHESTGYLVELDRLQEQLAERIVNVIGNDDLQQKMGEEAIRRVESTFTWRHTANRWMAHFCEQKGSLADPDGPCL
ncbi:glycosyltransferase family 4 protein [Paenibacillus sp. MBLB4367]|uniref:glycosyltransferase family 4 protein n=1 Tax=Paenibacillus sp. MBLB4367 TaxID=3384767 RepID=UPI0039081B7D